MSAEGNGMVPGARGFSKLDSGIVDSSLWVKDHDVLRVWIYMLARCDAHGIVRGSKPSIAHQCFISVERLEEIIEELCSPDPYSRTVDDEGRRLRRIDGGWVIVNYVLYRELVQRKDGSHAERQARYRRRLQARDEQTVTRDARPVTSDTEAEAEAEAEATKEQTGRPRPAADRFPEFWEAYPRKVKKKQARDVWTRKRLDDQADAIIQDVQERCESDPQWLESTKLIPHPTSYLNAERWTDEWRQSADGAGAESRWKRCMRIARENRLPEYAGAAGADGRPPETPEQFMQRVEQWDREHRQRQQNGAHP